MPNPSSPLRRVEHGAPPGGLTISGARDGDAQVVSLTGELASRPPAASSESSGARSVGRRRDRRRSRRLTFIGSSGLRVFVATRARCGPRRLLLVNEPRAVQRAFEICGLTALLGVQKRSPEAEGAR
ncbi:MAG TPA: STAS domain-containing protein [Solirubrobacteraceae bacterium]|jgi:anti-anti-sigma factor|nr:STAS domain-containing protein [Solirubrobacteraceae bacterium]